MNGLEKQVEDLKAEKRLAKEALRAAKAELRICRTLLRHREAVYQAVPSILVVVQDGRIADVNDSVAEQLGFAPGELLGRPFLDLVASSSRSRVRDIHARRLARKAVPEQYEALMMTRAGQPRPYEVRVRKILLRGKRAFVLSLTPMDMRREREENRLHSKKMEAVLTMASALAGRFGRHCAELRTRVEELKKSIPETHRTPASSELSALEHVADDALRTTRQLETIAREDMVPSEAVLFDLRDVVKEAVNQGKAAVEGQGPGIAACQVKTYLRSGAQILGSPEDLRDVIAHLVRNALEAMPRGGDLYVTSEEGGGQAHLTIMDNGMGVPEQVMDRIFDPFFTTRGKGASGLGLSVAYAVIRRHGGVMEVSSEKGQGTEIRVRIPLAPREPLSGRPSTASTRPVERLLVIASSPVLRQLMDRFFPPQGWQVAAASSAREGLGLLRREVYSGVILEDRAVGGREAALARRIRERHGELPVILVAEKGRKAGKGDPGAFDLVARKPLFMETFTSRALGVFSGAAQPPPGTVFSGQGRGGADHE